MTTLMGIGWGTDDPGFRQLFTSLMMPGATKEQAAAWLTHIEHDWANPVRRGRWSIFQV